jgi:hypothetical protein
MKRLAVLLLAIELFGPALRAIDRDAFTVTRYDLDVQIDRPSHVMAVTGRLTLRNDSKSPQKYVPLQVSSSLSWNGIAKDNKPIEWIQNNYPSDIDHTGAVSEAVATLPAAVAPGETISIDLQYGGTITPDATRFNRIGAPEEIALRNDWDQIGDAFTAVRGLGHVVWYPVSIPSVSLSEGNTVFAAITAWQMRHERTSFDAALHVDGEDVKLCIAGTGMTQPCGDIADTKDPRGEGTISRITNRIHLVGLAKAVPAFATANYARLERPGVTVLYLPGKSEFAKDYAAAAETNEAVLNDWLPSSETVPMVIELADPNVNPYQDDVLLFTPLRLSGNSILAMLLMPVQVAARFPSPRPWIEDGLQRFVQALGVEQRSGRKEALQFLNEYLPVLQKAEESEERSASSSSRSSRGTGAENPLVDTSDEIVLRGKGAFVFWMLRDMLGDEVLQRALKLYRTADDKSPSYLQGLLEDGRKRDLEWFFDDWVYRDRGLPEFKIEAVHGRPLLENSAQLYLVTVTIENRGGAGAEVPVAVQAASGERMARVLVPARQKTSARVQVPGAPTQVVANDGSVPVSSNDGSTFTVPQGREHP